MTITDLKKIPAVTAEEMRELDRRATREFGIPSLLLMENAGRSVAEYIAGMEVRRIVIACGKGNNGGDGFVCARHLANMGREVVLWLASTPEESRDDAALNLNAARAMGIPVRQFTGTDCVDDLGRDFSDCGLIVDALLGIGVTGPVRAPMYDIIRLMNQAGKNILAVDVPSGIHTDTGEAPGIAVKAQTTVTLGLPKKGLLTPAGSFYAGKVVLAGIGLPFALTGIRI